MEWVQYPEDSESTRTEYTYDSMYRQASAVCETDTALTLSANYTFEDDYLTAIQTPTTTYHFAYGAFGLQESVSAGDQQLVSYSYNSDWLLQRQTYGNGDYVHLTYDTKGRPTVETHVDMSGVGDDATEVGNFTVKYFYDNDGNLASVKDGATGHTITHYYDLLGRPMKSVETGTGYSHSVEYGYNAENNLQQLIDTINGTERTTSYEYDDDNRVTSVTTDGTTVEYTYDDFGRVTQQVTKNGDTTILTEEFEYTTATVTDKNGAAITLASSQIATYKTTAGGNTVTYSYEYDDNGNITSVTSGGKTTSYVYDSANQLIRENNQAGNFTHTWTYDNAGNIRERKEYAYTTGDLSAATRTVNYGYPVVTDPENNTLWGDLLTSYDGKAIEYDAICNPTKFGVTENGGGRTYTWEHGRQLKSLTEGSTTWTYTYDAGGLRTGRTNGTSGGTYTYTYTGSQLTQMKKGTSNTLTFTYDASGTPLTVTHNGTKYYYTTNLQGDVVAILDASGATAASYTYDAWGKCLNSYTSGIGFLNPLRYRGYVYDQETQLYYLQSRYYDPAVGRFLNADVFAATGQGFVGNNMFAYCGNNPVIFSDYTGCIPVAAYEKNVSVPKRSSPQKKTPNSPDTAYTPDGTTMNNSNTSIGNVNQPTKGKETDSANNDSGFNWDKVFKDTIAGGISGAAVGMTAGFAAGSTAAAPTLGSSSLVGIVVGGLIGFAEGGLTAFISSALEELWD